MFPSPCGFGGWFTMSRNNDRQINVPNFSIPLPSRRSGLFSMRSKPRSCSVTAFVPPTGVEGFSEPLFDYNPFAYAMSPQASFGSFSEPLFNSDSHGCQLPLLPRYGDFSEPLFDYNPFAYAMSPQASFGSFSEPLFNSDSHGCQLPLLPRYGDFSEQMFNDSLHTSSTTSFGGFAVPLFDIGPAHAHNVTTNLGFCKSMDYAPIKPAPHDCQTIRVLQTQDLNHRNLTQDHFFERFTAPRYHPVFISGKSVLSPVSQRIGIPLIIYREPSSVFPTMTQGHRNNVASSLLFDLDTGADNFDYRENLGTSLVARLDYQPLSIGLLTTLHAYAGMLKSERYGKGCDSRVQDTVSASDFTEFARKFVDDTKKSFNSNWNNLQL